jgi:ribose transport system permease protein
MQAPAFFNGSNLLNLLVNNFALLALVSLGMTLVVSTGGIDLSVGTAIDIGSLAYISLVSSGRSLPAAVFGGLFGAILVGSFSPSAPPLLEPHFMRKAVRA